MLLKRSIYVLLGFSWILFIAPIGFCATATVSGTIIDEADEKPVAGAKVELSNANAGTGFFVSISDTDGRFSFSGVRSNLPYDLTVLAEGYCPHEMRYWQVPDNQTSIDLKLPLVRGAIIRGTVTQSDGSSPLPNAKVELRYESGNIPYSRYAESLFTDRQGAFSFAQLPANVYTMTISLGGYLEERLVGVRPQPGEEKNYSIKLFRPASISGYVTLADDESPLTSIEAAARGASQQVGTSDGKGFFTIADLRPGNYKLESRPSGFHPYESTQAIHLEEGWNLDNFRFSMKPLPPSLSVNLRQEVFLPDEDLIFQVRTFRIGQYESTIYRLPVQVFTSNDIDVKTIADDADLSPFPTALQWTVDVDFHNPYVWIDKDLKAPDRLEPGIYLLQIASPTDGVEDRILFFVTELGIVTKRGEHHTFVYATHLRTSMPVPAAKILIQERAPDRESSNIRSRNRRRGPSNLYWTQSIQQAEKQEIQWRGETNEQGIFMTESPYESSNVDVIALSPDGHIAVSSSYRNTLIDVQQAVIFVYTDRPVYRPNHTVFYKAVIRENTAEGYVVPQGSAVHVTVNNPNGEQLVTGDLKTNEWGSIENSFSLPSNAPLGQYSIEIRSGAAVGSISFYLEEYRKPEFKVTLEAEKPFYVSGETVRFAARAEYYFGAPVVNGKIRYRFYESIASGDFYRRFPSSYSSYLSGGETVTDLEGNAPIEFTPRRSSSDRQITLEVDVEEASGRNVSARESVPIGVGRFYITVRPVQQVFDAQNPIKLNVETFDHNNKPVSVSCQVEFTQDIWSPVRRRYVRPSRPFADFTVMTDEHGQGVVEWLPDSELSGRFETIVTGVDEFENRITASASFWRMSSSSGSFNYRYSTLEGILDKNRYAPGEEAVLLINTEYPENPIVMTIECRDILLQRVIWPSGKTTRVKIPILESYAPNVYIGLFMPRGKYLSNRVYTLSVPEHKGELLVEVKTDKESYKPQETGDVFIKTTLPDGKPTAAEVSLAVVDEAIFAIRADQTPDIHRIFYSERANWVTTSFSFPLQYYGGADKGVRPDLRKDFRDTAEWLANIYTDENGEASVQVRFPDNLTTWRLTSRAHTKQTDVGWTKSTTKVTKELVARLSLPRFFVEGDDMELPTIVHNLTEENLPEIRIRLDIDGGVALKSDNEKTTQAAAGATARDLWSLTVNAASPEAVFTFEANGKEDSDAVQLQAPVLPAGIFRDQAITQRISDHEQTLEFEIPDKVLLNRSQFTFTLTPSTAAVALGAIPYLENFPYGCTEQTLNGFLPSIILIDALETIGALHRDEQTKNRMEKEVRERLSHLYSFQNWDGGWGWYSTNETQVHLTALVVHGLEITRRLGYAVDQDRLNRGVQYLENHVHDSRDWDSTASTIFVLSEMGKGQDLVEELYANRNELYDFGLATGSLALLNLNKTEQAAELRDALLSRIMNISDQEAAWEVSSGRFWHWNGTAIETSAWGLMALAKQDGAKPILDKIVHWLVRNRQGRQWRSTRESGLVVQALATIIAMETGEQAPPTMDYTLTANGQELYSGTIKPDDYTKPLTFTIDPSRLKQGKNEFKLQTGQLSGFWSLNASLFHHGKTIRPIEHEQVSIHRLYERAIHTKDYQGRPKIMTQGIAAGEPLNIGQEILVTLVLQAKQELPYMIVEEPLPGGCEVVESFLQKSLQGWNPYSHYERRDQKMVFFLDNAPKGETRIEYLIRTELGGSFLANPCHAWCMYYPEVNAFSGSHTIFVKQK
jgi:uncharacterized protein YfaS (alpha-2-macroglobulin family)